MFIFLLDGLQISESSLALKYYRNEKVYTGVNKLLVRATVVEK